tara:strand:- start:897 stop:1103 length:207 start_codon:yes stop_codon:yes gene_type:complete
MKKPLMTVGCEELFQCFHCKRLFKPENMVYRIGEPERYCSKICLREEDLIQEEEAQNRRDYERSRYDA